jgi:hypothetical protein
MELLSRWESFHYPIGQRDRADGFLPEISLPKDLAYPPGHTFHLDTLAEWLV